MRVVQWTTGNVGRRSVIAIAANPGLELVGCFAWGADKVGRDVGELCGIEPLGVDRHRRRRGALRAAARLRRLQPEVARRRRDGADPRGRASTWCSTAAFITGHSLGEGRDRLIDACERGGVSIFGSGINPGFANMLAILVGRDLRPGRLGHDARVGRLHRVRLPRDRAQGRLRPPDRRPRAARDGRTTAPRCSRTRCGWSPAGSGIELDRRALRGRVRAPRPPTSS